MQINSQLPHHLNLYLTINQKTNRFYAEKHISQPFTVWKKVLKLNKNYPLIVHCTYEKFMFNIHPRE
jgi:hypothetical protein